MAIILSREFFVFCFTLVLLKAVSESSKNDMPQIQVLDFPKSSNVGDTVKTMCTVTNGEPPFQFRWLKDGTEIIEVKGKLTVMNLDEETLLRIKQISIEDAANYTCLVRNRVGVTTHISQLVIKAPPTWFKEPTNSQVVEGSTAFIDCEAKGYPQPKSKWSRTQGTQTTSAVDSLGGLKFPIMNNTLYIEKVYESHEGEYVCEVNNEIGDSLKKTIILSVLVPARFEEKFTAVSARKGESARLTCEAKGDQPLSVSWRSQGVEFLKEGNGRYEIFETMTEKGLSSELLLREVDRNDGAVYVCKAENPFGTDERTLKVAVLEVPASTPDVRTQEVWSRSISLAWSEPYSGNSPVTQYHVQYWRNYAGSNHRLEEQAIPSSQTSTLLKGLHPGTSYAVALVAENAVGRSNPSETVTFITGEEEPSGAPVDVTVKPKGSSTLHVAWKAPPKDEWNGQLTGFYVGFKVRGTSQPYSFKTVDLSAASAAHDYQLSGLRKDAEYGIVVQAFNAAGSGPPSQEVVVRTLGGDLPPPPAPFVVDTNGNSIRLQWTMIKTRFSSSGSPVTGYVIHYKKEGGSWQQLPIIPSTEHSFVVNNLDSHSSYQLYMTSSNDYGEGDPSHALSIRTEAHRGYVNSNSGSGGLSTGQLVPGLTDPSLMIPVAASMIAVMVVIIVACFWIRRVRTSVPTDHLQPVLEHPYMNGTLRSEKAYSYLTATGQRYVDVEKARPLTLQGDPGCVEECLYPAPYATLPIKDDTFRKMHAANQEMKIFLPQSLKDRPLPNPNASASSLKREVQDSMQ